MPIPQFNPRSVLKVTLWEKICMRVNFLDELTEELTDYYQSVRFAWRNLKYGFKNLKYWLPTIWQDRDWDQSYIYDIFVKKLRKQAEFIDKHGIHLYKDRDVRQMRLAANLLDRVSNDNYYDLNIYNKKLETEFGRLKFTKDFQIRREHVITEADWKRERFLHKKAAELDRILITQDLELFGKIMRKYSRNWWD